MPTESEIISRIRRRSHSGGDVLIGVGDDAAVLKNTSETDLLACCDLMVEGVHFQLDWTTARMLGRKALAVNLSDIAAMGGVPKFAMISIALPHRCPAEFVHEFFGGIAELADEHGVSIVGGDTSSSRDSLFIDVSVIGECETGKAITRRGARIGDQIYVSGSLGASALGLSLLKDGCRLEDLKVRGDSKQQAIIKHLAPEPRLKLGRALGKAGLATSMIDISDGLSTDLWHILDESHAGALIHAEALPVAGCVTSLSRGTQAIDPLRLALDGGEDYELLFTVRAENEKQLMAVAETIGTRITAIGEIVGDTGLSIELNGAIESVERSGYEHLI
jgi:thiamine-monophosphate kinase